jgi:hypothetical protein
MKIIVLQNQEQFGPFDLDQLQFIVNEGHFQLTDYCWAEGWSEWKLLSTVAYRIPTALQGSMPLSSDQKLEESTSEHVIMDHADTRLPHTPSIEEPLSYSPIKIDNSNLKAGMVVKNDSQSVSCDFITSLAVRGVYVTPKTKIEDLPSHSNFTSEISLYVAREGQIIGCYNFLDILGYLDSGALLPTDLLWNESAGEWVYLSIICNI